MGCTCIVPVDRTLVSFAVTVTKSNVEKYSKGLHGAACRYHISLDHVQREETMFSIMMLN